jgi:putative salt-induced outer membrane protein
MNKSKLTGLLIGSLLSGATFAAESDKSWSGEAELGLISTTGNTETQTLSGKAKIENNREKWHHSASIEALNSESEDTTTAERYTITGKTDYKISDRSYAFARLSYEDDRFSGYEYQATGALGMGYKVFNQERLNLDVEGGPGMRKSKVEESGDTENETTLYLSGLLDWKLSDTSNFTEELTSEIGEDITITKSIAGLKTQVNGSLAMKITYTVKHTSDVPVGVEETDTETAVTLVYGF